MENSFTTKILAIFALFFALTISPAYAEEPVKVEIIKEIQMKKNDIYNNSLLWIAESFKSSKSVIDLKDPELGTIIGNGAAEVTLGWLSTAPIKFKLKIDIKDNKYRLTFKNVIVVFDGYDKPIEDANRQSLEPKVTEKFNEIATNLDQYLATAGSNSDW